MRGFTVFGLDMGCMYGTNSITTHRESVHDNSTNQKDSKVTTWKTLNSPSGLHVHMCICETISVHYLEWMTSHSELELEPHPLIRYGAPSWLLGFAHTHETSVNLSTSNTFCVTYMYLLKNITPQPGDVLRELGAIYVLLTILQSHWFLLHKSA